MAYFNKIFLAILLIHCFNDFVYTQSEFSFSGSGTGSNKQAAVNEARREIITTRLNKWLAENTINYKTDLKNLEKKVGPAIINETVNSVIFDSLSKKWTVDITLSFSSTKLEKELGVFFKQDWELMNLYSGENIECMCDLPTSILLPDNFLEIEVGHNTDVIIKIVQKTTNNCFRAIYIKGGNTEKISRIPLGIYYLKIAYGKKLVKKYNAFPCFIRFSLHPFYERGKDELNFELVQVENGFMLTSYKLYLDVISEEIVNSFDSRPIDEKEFNK